MYLTLDEIATRVTRHMERSQTEMADQIGVSQPVVSQALNAKRDQRRTLFRIAREVGCTIEEEPYYFFKEPSQNARNE